MSTLTRRLLTIAAVVAFIVLGNLAWEPAQVEPPPVPAPPPACGERVYVSPSWANYWYVEPCD